MTSFWAKEQNFGGLMPTFRILGQNYHQIGYVLPPDGEEPSPTSCRSISWGTVSKTIPHELGARSLTIFDQTSFPIYKQSCMLTVPMLETCWANWSDLKAMMFNLSLSLPISTGFFERYCNRRNFRARKNFVL